MSALSKLARFAMIGRGAKGLWRSLRDILVFTHRRFAVIQGAPRVNIGASEQHGLLSPAFRTRWSGEVGSRARPIWFGELDEPHTEGQLRVRALDPELVWLAHAHEPWRPRTV
jgi:hypothetical protein